MTISGVILTLAEDPTLADEAMNWIHQAPELTVGHREGRRIAAVAETESPKADRRLWHTLQEQPGIAHVDITGVFFNEDDDDSATDAPVSHNTVQTDVNGQRDEELNDARSH